MDEPSTGLDPASRKNLWNVVNRAKQDRAIILTSTFFLSHYLKHILVVALHRGL
jgi:ABC-type multidrug transport system ATPase subunit